MIIDIIEKNYYLIKLQNKKIDIYNRNELEKLITKIYKRITKDHELDNLIILDFYINKMYGTIITLKSRKNYIDLDNHIEIKINVHSQTPFLYRIDYFNIQKNYLKKENIYYYKNNFYLEIKNEINKGKYFKILELSELIYEDPYPIINNGIKLKI